jgi:catechol 2,3-dioxygenase-like lactoylglutathione lyase family enzyme
MTRAVLALCLLLIGAGCGRSVAKHAADDEFNGRAGTAPSGARGATLLGGERGLDHVGIAVTNLEYTTRLYRDTLGFSRPIEGTLPNGIRNCNFYFSDSTYLETLVFWDRGKAQWIADFTDGHSGALFAVLSVFSPEESTAFLADRGIRVGAAVSGSIRVEGDDAAPAEMWRTVFLPRGLLPGNPLYFISYGRAAREEYLHELDDPRARRALHHTNTALGLHAVWLAVEDLRDASRAYASIGLPIGKAFDDPDLGAHGQVFRAGAGELWLVAPTSAEGKLAGFLRSRGGPGIAGITLMAGSVDVAARVIEQGTGARLSSYQGQDGISIRVPPELTEGVWLEFAQKP